METGGEHDDRVRESSRQCDPVFSFKQTPGVWGGFLEIVQGRFGDCRGRASRLFAPWKTV